MKKIPRKALYIAGGVILAAFLFANEGFRKTVRRYWEINKLRSEMENLKKENDLLKKEVYFLEKDSSYIEHMARSELGLIGPGEVEYRFKKK